MNRLRMSPLQKNKWFRNGMLSVPIPKVITVYVEDKSVRTELTVWLSEYMGVEGSMGNGEKGRGGKSGWNVRH